MTTQQNETEEAGQGFNWFMFFFFMVISCISAYFAVSKGKGWYVPISVFTGIMSIMTFICIEHNMTMDYLRKCGIRPK